MDRVQLKMDAKAAMQQANPHPVLVALVYMVILAAISFVISMMSGVSSVFTTLVSNPDAAAAIYAGMMIPSILLSLVSTLVTGFLSMGFTAYTLRVINRHQRFVCLCQILSENLGSEYCYGLLRICMVTASMGSRNHCHVPLFPGSLHICGKSG